MKLGLVCNNNIRDDVLNKFQSLSIEVYRNADLYVVEEGLHTGLLPCIVFRPDRLDDLSDMLQAFAPTTTSSKIVGFKDDAYHVISHEDIFYFEALDAGVLCHTRSDVFLLKEKLYQLEARLPSDRYIKVTDRSLFILML